MIHARVRTGVAALTLAASLAVFSCPVCGIAQTAPGESWNGIYFNGKKIGFSSLHIENSTWRGKRAKRLTSHSVTNIEMLGNHVSQDVTSTSFTDSTYTPLYQEFSIKSNGSVMKLAAEFKPDKILCVVNGSSRKTIEVPPGTDLVGDDSSATLGKSLPPGTKKTFHFLNPLTVALDRIDLTVEGRESVTLAGHAYEANRISAATTFGNMKMWEAPDGDLLKGEMPFGMTLFRESRESARNMASAMPDFKVMANAAAPGSANDPKAYVPPSDFALATAITTAKKIPNPRSIRKLVVTVSGVPNRSLILSDERQRAESDKDGVWQLTINASRFDTSESASLPIRNPSVAAMTKPALYLESDNAEVRRIAAEIRGSETSAAKVAAAIRKWVHARMKPDYSMGVPRSCTELIHRSRGVCRDYATLFAGIARAAGIPTRLAAGIVYAEGRFFYHAWVECWVGRWTPLDPTLDTDFVDATHIKFAQGDVTQMFDVAQVVGRIKLEVVSME